MKGFIRWTPSTKPMAKFGGRSYAQLVAEVAETMKFYSEEWPRTKRGWLYRLMVRHGWEKSWEGDDSDQGLGRILNRGRRAGLIPWEAVTTARGVENLFHHYDNAEHLKENLSIQVARASTDLQRGQPRRLVLWIETVGYVDRFDDLAHTYGIDVFSGQGFDTVTTRYNLYQYALERGPIHVLHMGDLDAAGEQLYRTLRDDVQAFLGHDAQRATFERIGVLDHHIDQYDLVWEPADPVKLRKSKHTPTEHGRDCQAEALTIEQANAIAEAAVVRHLDRKIFDQSCDEARQMRLDVHVVNLEGERQDEDERQDEGDPSKWSFDMSNQR